MTTASLLYLTLFLIVPGQPELSNIVIECRNVQCVEIITRYASSSRDVFRLLVTTTTPKWTFTGATNETSYDLTFS